MNVPTDLQVAKFLQDSDLDVYGILDIPDNLRKTFDEQEIIKFKKKWDYREFVKKEIKVDTQFLEEFEKKYDLNLWSLIYTDRNLYGFNEYYDFDYDEILNIAEKSIRFYESILDEVEPQFVWIHIPDFFHIELFYEICRKRKIKILTLSESRLPNRYIISEKTDIFDELQSMLKENNITNFKTFKELRNLTNNGYQTISPKKHKIMLSDKTKIKGFIHYLFSVDNKEFRRYYANFGKTRIKIFYYESLKVFKGKLRKYFIDKNLKKEVNLDLKYAYFPLHVTPERSTLSAASYYANQFEVITHIAKSLPINFRLYVREHPIQSINNWREISFYKKIAKMPNVEIIHPSFSNEKLLKESSLIITITGSNGFTAAFYEKPSIVFTDVLYSSLSSVFRVNNLEKLPEIINSAINTKVSNVELNNFVDKIIVNSFEFDFFNLMAPMLKEFFYDGFTSDVYIPKDKIEEFINKNKIQLNQWGMELLKKINQHENFQK
jgi:hypothetical protein